jgi:microcystin-dependent protein
MQPTLAEIRMFAGNFAPRGWALCQGQLLPISQNQALFSLLGTIYGGDGRTTFALPDLRGRAPVSAGTGPGLSTRNQGQRTGTETVTMNTSNMPAHNHIVASGSMNASPGDGTTGVADGNSLAHQARGNTVPSIYNNSAPSVAMKPGTVNVTVGNTGNQQSINNMQPYLSINYIIALQGVFPSRS